MATQENPLLSLAPEKQQQLVDLVESNDIESLATKTGLTRRQILGIGATLAGSGALGGYAATEAIDPAQAQADTGDSDGNVGLPTDRVDVFADGIDSNSLSTESLVIGGTLYEEDGAIDVSNTSSTTYSLSQPSDDVIIIADPTSGLGFDELQVNAYTQSDYDYVDNADSGTSGEPAFSNLPRLSYAPFWQLRGVNGDRISLATPPGSATTGKTVGGDIVEVDPPITQITLTDSAGSTRDQRARVFRRSI